MANTLFIWKGAVEPASTSPSGNEIQLWKGAVEPEGAIVLSDMKEPFDALPAHIARYLEFIIAQGGTLDEALSGDWRNALALALGYTQAQALTKTMNDLWSEYYNTLGP